MTIRIAINGLGRIGRCLVRALVEKQYPNIELVAVNGSAATETYLHLLKYDSTHGFFAGIKQSGKDELDIGYGAIRVLHERDPEKLPWQDLKIDIVLECTGSFTKRADAAKHIKAGAKRVIISAPSNDADKVIVYGVNHHELNAQDQIISIGSCTTNCLAPIAKVLHENIGIEYGYMTTIHAFTSDQNLLDNNHKDLRRARSATASIVPTSTGAAKALSQVIPQLEGKLDGGALRVPVPNVSCVDLTFTSTKNTSTEEINALIQKVAQSSMKNIIAVSQLPLVSIDFNHNSNSCILDSTITKVLGGKLVHILMWYDNEWGFTHRMLDVSSIKL